MGYYSEVAYVIAFDDELNLGKFINYVFGSGDEHMITALKECIVEFDNKRVCFHSPSSKWYDSYEDVKGHTRLYELCHDEEAPFHELCDYRFIRIGEETEDIQEESSSGHLDPYDDFYVVRHINLPFDPKAPTYGDELEKLTPQPQENQA
jgi:hypothetical protein